MIDWAELNALDGDVLRDGLFSALQKISFEMQNRSPDDGEVLQAVPRLADLIEKNRALQDFRPVLDALARSVGLWNYIDKKRADAPEAIVAEASVVDGLGDISLHKEQAAALGVLLAGRNLILSAPTSFGKSLIIDALLASGRYSRVAIVLPTIALMDEFRRRMVGRFGDRFDVVMHHAEKPVKENVIFIGTQERLINRDDLGELDIAIVDEFYKLDSSRSDDRSSVLNAAVYKLLNRARQFFFLGPNIDEVKFSEGSRWRFEFIKTRFSTVAIDTFDLKGVPNKDERLAEEAYSSENWPALIFVSSPDKANQLAEKLSSENERIGKGVELAAWIERNYGAKWHLSNAVKSGLAVHHGRVPRALASRFVKLFNERKIPVLICTSTLIEGVNTAAKSVLIYDKEINKKNYDFFTFSNIRGRAGRLGQHHVGNVFLFHAQPERSDVDVDTPLFGDLYDAPDELLVHIEEDDVTPEIKGRIDEVSYRLGLDAEIVRRFASFGFDVLEGLRSEIGSAIKSRKRIIWRAWPKYENVLDTCELVSKISPSRTMGVATFKQLAMYLNKLSRSSSMLEFYHWHSGTYEGNPVTMDNVFKFLRSCEYNLPEYFSAIDAICRSMGFQTDYTTYIAQMQNWFRAEPLKALEEQGVPMQISERFVRSNDDVGLLRSRLRRAAETKSPKLSAMEIEWVLDAIPS